MENKKRNSLFTGSIILLLIIAAPYLLFLYRSIPVGSVNWDTWLGTIKGGRYEDATLIVYYFFAKFVPLLLLFIWFITNKHWWVHAIIIPISVYLFQLIAVINDSEEFMDEVEFIYAVPITVVVIVILYFIRSKMSIYIQAMDLKKEMDENMRNPKPIEK
jgi:hypothetical protein